MPGIDISIQAAPADLGSWLGLARRLEAGGFRALLAADHPGSGASPWPALGAAAAVTRTLGLGTNVAQAGVREPMHVAADAATLDILAPGRVLLGIGAGHTPREWADIGRDRPSGMAMSCPCTSTSMSGSRWLTPGALRREPAIARSRGAYWSTGSRLA